MMLFHATRNLILLVRKTTQVKWHTVTKAYKFIVYHFCLYYHVPTSRVYQHCFANRWLSHGTYSL